MDDLVTITARVGVVGIALIGGALYAFLAFIMAAFNRLPDAEGGDVTRSELIDGVASISPAVEFGVPR